MNDTKENIKKDYIKGLKQKEICDKYNISINTLKSWIKRYKWSEEKNKGAPINKKGAPLNNKNAVGHGAPKGNKNAEKFGFFSKYLPEETVSIMDEIMAKDPLDILWEQITIQYTAIIRAQRIMYVESKEEMIKELKKEEYTADGDSKLEYEFQFAWDRQATFLNAQSRAMGELRSLIKQYDSMLNSNFDLVTEEQRLRIEKLKNEVSNMNKEKKEKPTVVFTGEDELED